MAATRIFRRLEDLLDVDPTGLADGTVPVYNGVTEKHEYQTITAGPATVRVVQQTFDLADFADNGDGTASTPVFATVEPDEIVVMGGILVTEPFNDSGGGKLDIYDESTAYTATGGIEPGGNDVHGPMSLLGPAATTMFSQPTADPVPLLVRMNVWAGDGTTGSCVATLLIQTTGDAAGGGGVSSLTDLSDVTGTPGPGKAPVADETGELYPLTEVATQAYVDEQVTNALARWATLGEKLSFVDTLAGPWEASNPSVVLTPDGLAFGPYADGSSAGGSVRYHGLDGQPFAAVRNLAYNMRYLAGDLGASPYARVFLRDVDGNVRDAAFTPGSQDYRGAGPGPFQELVATAGMWRYDDDAGTGGVPLAELQAAHPDDVIAKITITLGFTDGTNLTGLLRWVQLNGNRYTFGSA